MAAISDSLERNSWHFLRIVRLHGWLAFSNGKRPPSFFFPFTCNGVIVCPVFWKCASLNPGKRLKSAHRVMIPLGSATLRKIGVRLVLVASERAHCLWAIECQGFIIYREKILYCTVLMAYQRAMSDFSWFNYCIKCCFQLTRSSGMPGPPLRLYPPWYLTTRTNYNMVCSQGCQNYEAWRWATSTPAVYCILLD